MLKYSAIATACLLVGCTPAQQQEAQKVQAQVEAAVQQNAAKITAVCQDVMLVANNPLTDVAAVSVPVVAQVQAAVKAGCSTAEGVAAMAKSASTVDWLQSARQVMQSGGAVLPPPVAPAPIAAPVVAAAPVAP